MQEVYQVLRIQTATSTAYHPQMDGHTEQANQEVEVLLWALIKEDQSDWAAMLPLVQFALNNCPIQSSDITPFLALHGYEPTPILELTLGEQVPEADKFLSVMKVLPLLPSLHGVGIIWINRLSKFIPLKPHENCNNEGYCLLIYLMNK